MVPTDELEGWQQRSRARKIALLLAITAAVGAIAYGFLRPAPAGRDAAPEFELPLVNGSGVLTSEELQGSPVVVNFFASWCLPCREEAPLLQETFERYRDQGVRFVGVAIRDAEVDTKGFVDKYGITYPVVHDPRESFARPVGVLGLPETYFIDTEWRFAGESSGDQIAERQGTVWFGPINEAELVRNIEALLGSD